MTVSAINLSYFSNSPSSLTPHTIIRSNESVLDMQTISKNRQIPIENINLKENCDDFQTFPNDSLLSEEGQDPHRELNGD